MHKGYTILAHNLKGFYGQFNLKWLLENRYEPKVIRQGSKLMSVEVTPLQIRFIDSFNFLPMGLSKLPKTFGKEEIAKGYFPHLFNRPENQAYVGALPDAHFFSPDTMSPAEMTKFYQWYEGRQSMPFNFQEEMQLYSRYVTIAVACMACYRSQHILDGTIAMMPQHGYVNNTNSSADSIRWIDYVAHENGLFISQAKNGNGEIKIGGFSVDGFCETTRTVYQYPHGCFYHGCSFCFNPDVENPVSGLKMNVLFKKTEETS
ncbi:hypothetical protein JTE90_028618 [Oedothorax gibbosus]|uniref:DNA-directed DNA polymerase n=1 Tax=Oedothorax gibbosus TaxID=931172 RepID=A0AAV6TYR5_9ARAC|nr:hypothetical protein JTE90_028618 [Oedothorax gibbosus]